MSDLDTSLRELRDKLHAAIPLPDVTRVAGRARTRRRLQLGAIAAVVAVALAVPVLRALPSDVRPAAPPPAPRPTTQLDFFDADHGYALIGRCEPTCAFTLHATADGGRTWAPRTLPAARNGTGGYFTAALYVLGPDEVVIDRLGASAAGWKDRVHSADGGRSWRVIDNWFAPGRVTSFSPDGVLTGACAPQFMGVEECGEVATIDPETGLTTPLTGQPRLSLPWGGASPTEGGTWWMTGRDRTTGRWTIAVSGDDGRSWTARPVAVAGVPAVNGWAVVEHDGIVYATAANATELLGVWRSTDRGHSWTRTWSADGDQWLPDPKGTPVAAGDGSLVLYDGTTTYVSTDLGYTFERTGEDVPGRVWWTRGGYVRVDDDEYALSPDGLRWRSFRIG